MTIDVQIVDTPGVYTMTADAYHGDPVPAGSLSSTGARRILPPGCPALYRWEADNGGEHKPEFDFGHAAHREVLGIGEPLAIVDAKDWRTTAAQAERDAAYAAGAVPLLAKDYEQVKAMAAALRGDPMCAALLNPEHGTAEQSMFWVDDEFEVWRRVRLDWFTYRPRPVVVDYKTTSGGLDDDSIRRTVHRYGYHQQAPFYLDALPALGVTAGAAFVFLFQQKTPPYMVRAVQLDDDALALGRDRNRAALARFRDCQQSGVWPGYSTDSDVIGLPRYAEAQWAADQYGEDR